MSAAIRIVPVVLVLASGCGGEDRTPAAAPPPAVVLAPVRDEMPLEEKLERLRHELNLAIEGGLEGPAVDRVFRAEAITDRLLEPPLQVQWLAEGYFLEARVRQIQSLADRIVAQLRRGEDRRRIMEDVHRLHRDVENLLEALTESGVGEPPPPLDSLLRSVEDERS